MSTDGKPTHTCVVQYDDFATDTHMVERQFVTILGVVRKDDELWAEVSIGGAEKRRLPLAAFAFCCAPIDGSGAQPFFATWR